jgi:hypothetical protein
MDDEKFQDLIKKKCNLCFRKDSLEDSCMLFSLKHAGIEECLGPFKDQEDRTKKVREDFEKEDKQKADWKKVMREVGMNTYLRNKKVFDDWDIKRKSND